MRQGNGILLCVSVQLNQSVTLDVTKEEIDMVTVNMADVRGQVMVP